MSRKERHQSKFIRLVIGVCKIRWKWQFSVSRNRTNVKFWKLKTRFPQFGFYLQKQLLLSARFSHRNSVCLSVRLSVTRMDQSKTMQDMITKYSPSLPEKL